jgi:uncharacterized repeat protein (TIGR02543 family)
MRDAMTKRRRSRLALKNFLVAALVLPLIGVVGPLTPVAQAATPGSIYFDDHAPGNPGGNQFVQINAPVANSSAFNFTGVFSAEMWIKRASSFGTGYADIISGSPGGVNGWLVQVDNSGGMALLVNGAVISMTKSATGMAANTWSHFVLTRYSDNLLAIYLNGKMYAYANYATTLGGASTALYLGDKVSTTHSLKAQVSNVRVTTNAVYGSTSHNESVGTRVFTPPIGALQTTQGSSTNIAEISSGQTTLLMNTLYDGTLATAIADSSGTGVTTVASNSDGLQKSVSKTGYTPVADSNSPFGPDGSLFFSAETTKQNSSNWITLTTNVITAPGTGEFTYEMWFKTSLVQGNAATGSHRQQALMGTRGGAPDFDLTLTDGKITAMSGAGTYSVSSDYGVVTENTWYHVAYVRALEGGTLTSRLYLNGNRVGTGVADPRNMTSKKVFIGHKGSCCSNEPQDFWGYLSNIRISNTAEYRENFVKPNSSPANTATTQLLMFTRNDDSYKGDWSSNSLILAAYSTNPIPASSSEQPFKTNPVITWSVSDKTYGDLAFTLNPTASVPGTFSYSSDTPTVITLSGANSDTATVVGAGTTVLRATFTPTDQGLYSIIDSSRNVVVAKATQNPITLNSNVTSKQSPYTQAVSMSTTGGSGNGARTFSVSAGTATGCSLLNSTETNTITATSPGTCLLSAQKAADSNYLVATSSSLVFTFSPISIVTYDGNGNSSGTVNSSVQGLSGETFTVGAGNSLVKDGYTFSTWNNGANNFAVGSTYTLSLANETLTAQWNANTYTLTYNVNGGTAISAGAYTVGGGSLVLPTAVRTGYTFNGWFDSTVAGNLVGLGGENLSPNASRTIYAQWTPKIFTVTYSSESGTASMLSETYTVGSSPLLLPTASRTSYIFDGWFTSRTGGSYLGKGSDSFTPTETGTVYAQWTQSSFAGTSAADRTLIGTIPIVSGVGASVSYTTGIGSVAINIPVNALTAGTSVTIYALNDSSRAQALVSASKDYVLSLLLSWLAPDGTVPTASSAITTTITNAAIKAGATVYGMVGNTYEVLTTATNDGYVVIPVFDDPVITIANPVVTPPAAVAVIASVDNSAAIKAAQDKAAADLQIAREKAAAELKAAQDAEALLKAQESTRIAAELKAKEDAALAAAIAAKLVAPDVTLYSISPSLKLSAFDTTYLNTYVNSLKKSAKVTCIGYIYTKNTTLAKAKLKATNQAKAVCSLIKKQKKTLVTNVLIYPSSKAPKAASGAKWVAVSYRVDGYQR